MEKLLPENRKESKALLKDLARELAGRPAKMMRAFDLKGYVQSLDVKAARKKTNLSQPKFAVALGLSHETLRSWETGRRHPRGLESKIIRLIADEPKMVNLLAMY